MSSLTAGLPAERETRKSQVSFRVLLLEGQRAESCFQSWAKQLQLSQGKSISSRPFPSLHAGCWAEHRAGQLGPGTGALHTQLCPSGTSPALKRAAREGAGRRCSGCRAREDQDQARQGLAPHLEHSLAMFLPRVATEPALPCPHTRPPGHPFAPWDELMVGWGRGQWGRHSPGHRGGTAAGVSSTRHRHAAFPGTAPAGTQPHAHVLVHTSHTPGPAPLHATRRGPGQALTPAPTGHGQRDAGRERNFCKGSQRAFQSPPRAVLVTAEELHRHEEGEASGFGMMKSD